jgi:hypothetical protein
MMPRFYGPVRLLLDVLPPLRELLKEAFVHIDQVLDRRTHVRRHSGFVELRHPGVNAAVARPRRQVV